MKPSALLIGLAAGVASALLFAGLVLQSATAVGLSLAAPIPIYLASLGWGNRAGFLAAAAAALFLGFITSSVPSGLTLLATMALPAAIVGHLAGLARPAADVGPVPLSPSPRLDWYPLERVLLAIAICVTLGCLVLGWIIGFNPAELAPAVAEALGAQSATAPNGPSAAQLQELSKILIGIIPFVQPAVLVFVHVAALYIAAAIVRVSGRLPRPKDDLPSAACLPKPALAALAVAIAGCFAGGLVGAAFAVMAGAFAAAFTLVGLAAVHRRTRGRAARGLLLFTSYAAILLLSFPIAVFTLFGIVETVRRPAHAVRP